MCVCYFVRPTEHCKNKKSYFFESVERRTRLIFKDFLNPQLFLKCPKTGKLKDYSETYFYNND